MRLKANAIELQRTKIEATTIPYHFLPINFAGIIDNNITRALVYMTDVKSNLIPYMKDITVASGKKELLYA